MRQRKPDGADLLPAGRQAVDDPSRDDQVRARVVVAEGQSGMRVEQARRRPHEEQPRQDRERARCDQSPAPSGWRGGRRCGRARGDQGALSLHSAECIVSSPGCRLRPRTRRPGPVPHRLPRFVVPVVSRSRRPADHLARHRAQGADALLRAARRRSGRSPAASRCTCRRARVAKRFCAGVSASATSTGPGRVQKYGLLAVAVPSLLPPPVPFKPFVLAAGVAGVRPCRFSRRGRPRRAASAISARRCSPSGTASGRRNSCANNARPVSLGLAVVVLVGGVALDLVHRRRQPRSH